MKKLLLAVSALCAAAFGLPASSWAATYEKFDPATFEAAVKQGGPVLVDVKAWWCPVCASQNRTIKAAVADPRFAALRIFELNYDKQRPQWQALSVRKQGTLIGYRGGRESGRLQFVTEKAQIEGLLAGLVR